MKLLPSIMAIYPVCIFFFVLFLRGETDARLTEELMKNNAEVLRNIKEYEIIKPYRLVGRMRRHASTKMSSGHVQETTLVFPGRKKRFVLDVALNTGLFSSQFEQNSISRDTPEVIQQVPHEHCFYHGTVQGEENSAVSLSTCDGIEGVIRTDDETFYIQPLKSPDDQILDDHLIFNAEDVDEPVVTCGHSSHKTLSEKVVNHKISRQSTNVNKRVRRNVQTETKYVEFYIINDNEQYRKWADKTELRTKQLVNHLDSIYRYRNIRIALVQVDTWRDGNRAVVDRNVSRTLTNFLKYKSENLDKHRGKYWDNVQLLTSVNFDGNTVGYAPIQSICGTRSAAVVQDHRDEAAATASTMAHELGHNFGMVHDKDNCECPDKDNQCVMSDVLKSAATRFSTCSLKDLRKTLDEGYGTCLFDEPHKLFGESICGNGFVEEGEQCDCGTQEECDHFENKCCNATTCMLHPGAACSHGECCENCQLRARGKLCRKDHDECDLAEYCTGENEMCPEDYHLHNGIPCNKNGGYCYGGVCRSVQLQCQYIFGKDISAGNERCFRRNRNGGVFFNCKNETHGKFACEQEDAKCGRIHCLSTHEKQAPIRGQQRSYHFAGYKGHFCFVPILSLGDGLDRQYVDDGAKCGEDKMCIKSKCLPVSKAIPVTASDKCSNCSGNGICNNKGNCHCNIGFACPDCKHPGQGGSVDSGQGCQISSKEASESGVNVAAAVLIPLFLLCLIGVAVIIYFKRRTIQDRLSHYKFVRRTTQSSNAPPPRKSGPSGLHPGLISNPAVVGAPGIQAARAPPPPGRPTAPLVQNEHPEPKSTPQPAHREPQRAPIAPVRPNMNPRTGHQSVPLFPPSAAPNPAPQEKPRPPPPTRPLLKSNLPRTPSAPPTAPNRPKLPPSQLPPNHNSVPDIPAAVQTKSSPSVAQRTNVPPRPKPRAPLNSHHSVPEFPEDVPVPKPRNVAPRPGHQSVPLFNLPDNPEDGGSVKPSAVKANQARPTPPRKPRVQETDEDNRVDFRAGLKPVPKPWDRI